MNHLTFADALGDSQTINIAGTFYVSAHDAARVRGVSQRHIIRLAADGHLPARRLGRGWFIALSALQTTRNSALAR